MANDGLEVGLNEFKGMKSLARDTLMYNNIKHIRKKIDDYKLHKKVQYVWLVGLTIFIGIKKFIGL